MSSIAHPRHLVIPAASESAPPLASVEDTATGSRVLAPHRRVALRIALAVSALAVVWIFWPYWGWLVLAAWFAALARPLLDRLSHFSGGRRRAAAILTMGLSILVLAPIALVVAALAVDAAELVHAMFSADSSRTALRDLVVGDATDATPLVDLAQVQTFLRAHADRGAELAITLAGSLLQAILGFMVLFSGAFVLLVEGPALFASLEKLTPASHRSMVRLRDAFIETGRGLLIGSGLTGLVQAVIATILYVALGVPRPFVLGFLTLVASVVPGVGTALIWVPITAGLLLAGRTPQAVAMGVLGTIFVAGIDNLVRPFFVRWGRLQLSPFIVMVSVFGGLAAIGAWGMLLGPIVVRLALEVLRIAREERVV